MSFQLKQLAAFAALAGSLQLAGETRTRAGLDLRAGRRPSEHPPTSAESKPDTTLIVSAGWLASHLRDPKVVVLHVDHSDSSYRAGHVAGTRFLSYMLYQMVVDGIGTELPPVDSLRALFESVGVSDDSHVIITGSPLMATRAFFTLDYLGLRHVSILDGGLASWRAAGGAVATDESPLAARGHITPHPHPEVVAHSDWLLAHLGKPGVSLIDTRTVEEYDGVGERRGLPSKGHLEGARRLEWQEAMRDPNEFAPKGRPELEHMWTQRVVPGDTVVAYCLVGYRASFTYFMSRYLGYPVKLYDGSYQEWAKKNLPLVTAATPLRIP